MYVLIFLIWQVINSSSLAQVHIIVWPLVKLLRVSSTIRKYAAITSSWKCLFKSVINITTLIFIYAGLRFVHPGGPPQQYAEMVNYCTMGSNNSIEDAPAPVVDLLDKKEQESVQVENKLECL
jgi:hypothetical protein